jgi:hypothetical protein
MYVCRTVVRKESKFTECHIVQCSSTLSLFVTAKSIIIHSRNLLEKGSWICFRFEVLCLMGIKCILLLSIVFNWILAAGDLSVAAVHSYS